VLPESQWRGYRPPAEPPGPAPETWGGPVPPLPSAVALAALEADLAGKVQGALITDPGDALARALASLGRAFMVRDSRGGWLRGDSVSPSISGASAG
jgi:hypothetical protein